jgi:hypothetical protein
MDFVVLDRRRCQLPMPTPGCTGALFGERREPNNDDRAEGVRGVGRPPGLARSVHS